LIGLNNVKRLRQDARVNIKNIKLNEKLDAPITPRLTPKIPKLITSEMRISFLESILSS